MNKNEMMLSGEQNQPADDEATMIDVLIVLAKNKKLLLVLPVAAAVVAAAVSLLLPNIYKASAKILPPQQAQSGAAALLSQLGSVAGAAAGAAGIKNPNDLYVGLLKSRTIADKLVAAHGLEKVYDAETREDARKELAGATDIDSGKDGLITIAVLDKDSKRAALLANAYVDELKKLTTVLAVTEAGQRRMFFERQLESTKDKLAKAEIALKGALDTHGVISVDSESRAVLVTMGRMRAQISAKEIELQSMGQFVTQNNQQYRQVQAEISSLRAELAKFENGRPADSEGSAADKQSGLENVKVLREVKYYQMLYELLAKQYEVARLDEAKDSYAVQLLDPAVEPERKSKPARALIVILSGALAFFAAVVIAFVREANAKSLQRPGGMARWNELKSHLRFRKQD